MCGNGGGTNRPAISRSEMSLQRVALSSVDRAGTPRVGSRQSRVITCRACVLRGTKGREADDSHVENQCKGPPIDTVINTREPGEAVCPWVIAVTFSPILKNKT